MQSILPQLERLNYHIDPSFDGKDLSLSNDYDML